MIRHGSEEENEAGTRRQKESVESSEHWPWHYGYEDTEGIERSARSMFFLTPNATNSPQPTTHN